IAVGQIAKLPIKALATGIFFSRFAPAVAAPVPEGLDYLFEQGPVRQNLSAFAHCDVMCRVEANCSEVAERTDVPTMIGAAQRITAIFDEPQVMFFGKRDHGIQVEGVA